MAQQHFLADREIEMVLLALQAFQVLFLWVHNWIPRGRLNDVAAVRSQDTGRRLVTMMLIQAYRGPSGYALACCTLDDRIPTGFTTGSCLAMACFSSGKSAHGGYPIFSDRNRSELYQIMFGKTHSFLPPRNGMVPNTAHILLHLATAATLIVLLLK